MCLSKTKNKVIMMTSSSWIFCMFVFATGPSFGLLDGQEESRKQFESNEGQYFSYLTHTLHRT